MSGEKLPVTPAEVPPDAASGPMLDVRVIVPRDRHSLILGRFEGLPPGDSFVLINDHDPRPLYYQFQAELTGRFTWEYLASGPEVWKVRIGKRPVGPDSPSREP